MKTLALFAMALLAFSPVYAQNVLSTELPAKFDSLQYSLGARGVGQACLTMSNLGDSVPCQPALLAKRTKGNFMAQAAFGNSYEAIENANHLLNKDVDATFMKSMFEQNRIMEMQANGELVFLAPHFSAQFIPYQISYTSVIRNKSYPVVALHALQSRIWAVQTGWALNEEIAVGAEASFNERKFIHTEFDAFEAAAEDGERFLKPRTQNSALFEPGIIYSPNLAWRPKLSAKIEGIGHYNHHYDELQDEPGINVGIGATPPLRWGRLELGIDYRKNPNSNYFLESLHAGVSYQFGHMTAVSGLSSTSATAGIMFGLDSIRAGIIYSSTRIPFADDVEYAQSIYSQFGLQI